MPSPADAAVPAVFLDGRSATRHAATARLAPPLLLIEGPAGGTLAAWPLGAVRVIGREGDATRLACAGQDARLLLGPDAAALLATLPAFAPPRRSWRRVAALAGGTLLVGAGLWFGGPLLADGAAMLVPQPAARAIGDMAVQQVTLGARSCAAPDGQAALDGLVARLAAAAGLPAPPEVAVVDRPEVNAFAVPGGRILLLRGLVARAGDAEEVAGVLAHEIGHLRHDHPLRGLMRALGLGVLASVLTGGSDVAGLGATLVSLANSRAFEAEADAEAVRILEAAGIGTAGLRRFFTRMDRGDLPEALRYLASHPPSAERRVAIPERPGTRPALSAEEWAALRRIC